MFDPWTATWDDALATEEKHEGESRTAPITRWDAARRIEAEREAVERGDGFAVLACIRMCLVHELTSPLWLVDAYTRRYDAVLNCRAGSWDEAFGAPYPRKHMAKLRQRRVLRFAVLNAINAVLDEEPRTPIDEALFERVGEEFGIGKTLCSNLYYEAKRFTRS